MNGIPSYKDNYKNREESCDLDIQRIIVDVKDSEEMNRVTIEFLENRNRLLEIENRVLEIENRVLKKDNRVLRNAVILTKNGNGYKENVKIVKMAKTLNDLSSKVLSKKVLSEKNPIAKANKQETNKQENYVKNLEGMLRSYKSFMNQIFFKDFQ